MASLLLQIADLRSRLGFDLGYGQSGWDAQQTADIAQALNSGLRQFYYPPLLGPPYVARKQTAAHRWSFFFPEDILATSAPYSTGTVTVVNGVVTLAGVGATFPTWAAYGELTVEGGTYTVKTYDLATQITLDDLTVNVAALTTYSLGRVEYALPADFGGLESPLVFRPEASTYHRPIQSTSWARVKLLRQANNGVTGYPSWMALLPVKTTQTAAQTWLLTFDVPPDAAYQLHYRYKINLDALDDTHTYPPGGQQHSETILASCTYAGRRLFMGDPQKVTEARDYFFERLAASIAEDERNQPEMLSPNTDLSDDQYYVPTRETGTVNIYP